MELPESTGPETIQALPDIGQHYVECDTEGCNKNCQFYCNPCHRPMCEQCKDEHLKSSDTVVHDVVFYRYRKRQLPEEKCKDHPTKDIDMLCEECQVLLCSKCATTNHRGHVFADLEAIYSEKYTQCMEKNHEIHKHFLPTTHDMQKEIRKDTLEIKTTMKNIRTSMKTEAEKLKGLVDLVISENIEQVDKIEESLLEKLQSQDKTYDDYSSYLNVLVKELHGYLSCTRSLQIIHVTTDKLEIKPVPETTKPVPPVFTTGQYSKEDVAKLLGRVDVPPAKPETRTIKLMETDSALVKPTQKQISQDREESNVKQILSLSSSVTEVGEYRVPDVENACHISLNSYISLGRSEKLWVSDWIGNLVETDLLGNLLQKIQTSGRNEGYHMVTHDKNLLFIDKDKKVVKMTKINERITELIKTGAWTPLSIHSPNNNGDILVGMIKEGEAQVARYNKIGKEIQNIQRDNKGVELYRYPHYLTENINGDICTSDFNKRAVVVVDKFGQHRFSYTGQGSMISPYGICTDVLGHIMVCETFSGTVHFLDLDGFFLRSLLTPQQGLCSVCVDDENNLYVGKNNTNTVKVYKYLN